MTVIESMPNESQPKLQLHGFFNSSASYRVRIALNLKGLAWEHVGVNLRTGEQHTDEFRALNVVGLVPTLQIDGQSLSQSLAIIDRLDRLRPEPRLVPLDGPDRDKVLDLSYQIACDIHPINNLRVLKYLIKPLGHDEEQKQAWIRHWISLGFDALEQQLPNHDGWCVGDNPSLADVCLIPQIANARRSSMDISQWPKIERIDAFARQHPAFAAAAPNQQPDFVPA